MNSGIEKEIVEKPETVQEEPAVEAKQDNPVDKIIEHIQKLDSGDGADTEEVVTNSNIENAEDIIENLLKESWDEVR